MLLERLGNVLECFDPFGSVQGYNLLFGVWKRKTLRQNLFGYKITELQNPALRSKGFRDKQKRDISTSPDCVDLRETIDPPLAHWSSMSAALIALEMRNKRNIKL